MMRTARILAAIAAATLTCALPASTAMAANATGCSGSAVSKDAQGNTLGTAEAPGAGGTKADPLPIDTAGAVAWKGSTDSAITNGTWTVTIGGTTFLSGTFANPDGATSAEGVQEMSAVPALLGTALTDKMKVHVEGTITGTGGSCVADGYVTGVTPPTSSPTFYAGAALGAVGLAMGIGVIVGTKAAAGAAAAAGGGAAV